MPLAGAIAWIAIGLAGALLPVFYAVWAIFIGTGMIFYLGIGIARVMGEDLLGKNRKGNFFDRVFLFAVGSSLLAYAIAIPFFLIDVTSLPLSVGILTGLMWFPFSALIRHWVGVFHATARTIGIVAVWYLFPDARFVMIPIVIVVVYAITIIVLDKRFKGLSKGTELSV